MTEFNYQQPYIGVGALIEHDRRFLLIEENHWPNQGLWNIPCGKLAFGETPESAAIREVREETGLDFRPDGILGIFSIHRQDMGGHYSGDIHILRIIYRGRATGTIRHTGDEVDSDGNQEISQSQWVTPAELTKFKLRYQDIPTLINRYETGKTLPLSAVEHIIQSSDIKT